MSHNKAVMRKIIPRISFRTGIIGLESAYFSSRLNTSNSSFRA